MLRLDLREEDIRSIEKLVDELAGRYSSVEEPEFQREAGVYAQELPRALRRDLREFHLGEPTGILVVSGLPVDDDELGPTPAHWKTKPDASPSLRYDIAFYLVASLLGEPIAWATQQAGRVMHDIFPIKEHEHEQIGWGSDELLTWHTEDAFHPLRTDYLGLMCLRNPDDVETTAADIADVRIDDETRRILSEPRFRILPDNSHRPENQVGADAEDPLVEQLRRRSVERVERALAEPEPVQVLFGSPEDPYVRIDPYYMEGVQGPEEQRALETFCAAVDAAMGGVVLTPGDMLFIDNYRVVHGRKPFRARFDGTDRWLRRLNVARDLRKSRDSRLTAASRVIY
ncbi:arginine beta-hydroxylase, Fe(II)/alpha-ketoglutarate-dependent [Streptoalloteichus tenebrarius]|uniref:Arginine beta-hydroxylase, Fe(II)/alpha-ketoglutarate-dependent n=1 Tax=Streptoalloteichus tenebrarius (strain ATCC 17920 / DSM 40477 / JCM 4838 / CBS 697.72 / NBRC 16177 / NCIMB 11028 / NRRL B-12390 / A12253. 1 / ISP 5477) TaxID=1933 RepID=A0ABT1HLQ3_STRSD|nr:guanitoxin biosynthesis L-enduracididine beta-hydroxylase GntD [Streptoalloteichus tenebrarius]MCP2256428.1 arginine beta-hydroxylase, Fe(II)/alpha-ketoglutarate-dependent [Streptoalloteichus tenebrarius]BFF04779.1 clavaminate synthase family protein [Streptoalloteichus tenebrarius]